MTKTSAASLHEESIIIDGLEISRWDEETFVGLREGGLTAINATVAILEGFRDTIANICEWHSRFDAFGSLITPVTSVKDIERAKDEGKTGIIFGFQNISPIEDDLDLLQVFVELGVRIIQLTYMERNYAGDGCLEDTNCGLSRFGREVIEEMNRLGILIDLSHVGGRTTLEAIEASRRPVAFSHANPRALCDHARNKTDEEITALAEKGGVIGANVYPPFLAAGSEADLDDVVDVVDYLVDLVGIDHVGIGTDFTRGQPPEWFDWILTGRSRKGPAMDLQLPIVNPKGIRSASEFMNLTEALLERGYGIGDVKKIMGENWLRLFDAVWN